MNSHHVDINFKNIKKYLTSLAVRLKCHLLTKFNLSYVNGGIMKARSCDCDNDLSLLKLNVVICQIYG